MKDPTFRQGEKVATKLECLYLDLALSHCMYYKLASKKKKHC
jgi:hypothetical protein